MTDQSAPIGFKARRGTLKVVFFVESLGTCPALLNFALANKEGPKTLDVEQNNLSFWVNSKHLNSQLQTLTHQVKTHPGSYAYSYAYVVSDPTHQMASQKLSENLGLSLVAVPFMNWTHAVKAFAAGRVDVMFVPAAFIRNYFGSRLPSHLLPVFGH